MTDIQNLNLLLFRLYQMDNTEKILQLFLEAIRSIFGSNQVSFNSIEKVEDIKGFVLETKKQFYGSILIENLASMDFTLKIGIENAVQMLRVVLENCEIRAELKLERTNYKDISAEKISELENMYKASANLVEDLNEQIELRKKAERELKDNQERLRLAVEATSDIIWDWNLSTNEIYFSDGWYQLLGIDKNKINWSRLFWKSILHPDDYTKTFSEVANSIRNQDFFELDFRVKNSSGKWSWMQCFGAVVKNEKTNKIERIAGTYIDITEKKMLEEELNQSRENLKHLINQQNDLVVEVDVEGKFIFVNDRYCEMFGKSKEELLGKQFLPLVHEDDRKATAEAMEKIYSEPYRCFIEQRAMTKDGWKWLAWSDRAVLNYDGEVKSIIGVGRDISDRKISEQISKTKLNEITILNTLASKINKLDDYKQVIKEVLNTFVDVSNGNLAFYFKRDGDELWLKEMVDRTESHLFKDVPTHKVGECMCGIAAKKNEATYSIDIFNDLRCTWDECKNAKQKSFAALPLAENDLVFGVIGIASDHEIDFRENSDFLETIASQVSAVLLKLFNVNKLKQSEEMFRTLADSLPDTVFTTDLIGDINFINRPLSPFKNEDVLGINVNEFIPIADIDIASEAMKYVSETLTSKSYETNSFNKENNLWLKITITPKLKNGKIEGFIWILSDITETKLAQLKLVESEKRFKTLVKSLDGIFYIIAKDGTFLLSEGRGLDDLNLSPGDVVGKSVFELYKNYPEMLNAMEETFSGEFIERIDQINQVYFQSWYSPYYDSENKIIGLMGLSVNITERRLEREELEKYKQKLETMVDKQTDELKQKNDMISKMNDLFAGREKRIKELQEKINNKLSL